MSDISDQNEKMVSQLQFGKCNLSQEHAADGNLLTDFIEIYVQR